jgi:multicomponent Na+:H+ antiporter subunit B
VVSSVNYDQRALDTLGEETILLGSVVGAAALLRPSEREREADVRDTDKVLPAVRLLGYLLLPVTLMVGANLVAHGQLTPGGGFQGGVVLGTGVHLVYLTGRYEALERVRPLAVFNAGEAVGTAAFVALGIAGVATGAGFLANVVPTGRWGALLSGGTVPLLSIAVGIEVASGVVVLLTKFLEQALRIKESR